METDEDGRGFMDGLDPNAVAGKSGNIDIRRPENKPKQTRNVRDPI